MKQAKRERIARIVKRKTYTGRHSRRAIAARRLESMGIAPDAARKLAF